MCYDLQIDYYHDISAKSSVIARRKSNNLK